jgi:hypothetical protein
MAEVTTVTVVDRAMAVVCSAVRMVEALGVVPQVAVGE